MSQTSYIWAVGYHRNDGSPSICGPYLDQHEAVQKTDHLTGVQYHRLGTRNRNAAIPQLKDRIRGSPMSRGPAPESNVKRSWVINRILRRKSKQGDQQDNADNADPPT